MRHVHLEVVAIPTAVADLARTTLRDEFGHALHEEIVDGPAPCRHCLRIAMPGERMILFSYRPFASDYGPYSEVGPIFIHADACERYGDIHALPPDFANRELLVRAYDGRHVIHDSAIAGPGEALERAGAFLDDPRVAYVHARHHTYSCFDFKIERAGQSTPHVV